MTNAVTQAGYAQVPQQAASRTGHRNDAPGGAFRDAVQSGEKKPHRTGPSTGEESMAAAGITIESRHQLGQPWRAAAKVDSATIDGERPISSPSSEAQADQKLLGKITGASPEDTGDAAAADTEKRNADKSADGMLPELAAFLDAAKRPVEADRKQIATSGGAPGDGDAAAVAGGKIMQPPLDAKSTFRPEGPPTEHAGKSSIVADAGNDTDKGDARNSAKASEPTAATPTPQENRGAEAERASSRGERALVEGARAAAREATHEARQTDASTASPKVSVINTQTLPAPANSTTTAFISAISSDAVWKAAAPEALSHLSAAARPHPDGVHSLKIQLHPAELGMVTADLRFAGEQLSVELKVESAEAYHRLSRDADTIVKAFRALGYEIDQVTIQQPQPAGQAARADTGSAGSGAFSRDLQSTFSGNSGGDGARSSNREPHAEGGNDARHSDGGGAAAQNRSSRGLYI